SLHALEERVVQVARDPFPLLEPSFHSHSHLAGDLLQAESIDRREEGEKGGYGRGTEPRRLVVRGGDGKVQGGACLGPHPAVVAGDHPEAIVTRRETAVERLPPIAGFLPVAIPAFQLVTKEDLLGRDKAWRGVVDLEVPNESGQGHERTGTSR